MFSKHIQLALEDPEKLATLADLGYDESIGKKACKNND
jgi:hypothetical protein